MRFFALKIEIGNNLTASEILQVTKAVCSLIFSLVLHLQRKDCDWYSGPLFVSEAFL
jgi:hypothetical protein